MIIFFFFLRKKEQEVCRKKTLNTYLYINKKKIDYLSSLGILKVDKKKKNILNEKFKVNS
jgi:hypothetical protein